MNKKAVIAIIVVGGFFMVVIPVVVGVFGLLVLTLTTGDDATLDLDDLLFDDRLDTYGDDEKGYEAEIEMRADYFTNAETQLATNGLDGYTSYYNMETGIAFSYPEKMEIETDEDYNLEIVTPYDSEYEAEIIYSVDGGENVDLTPQEFFTYGEDWDFYVNVPSGSYSGNWAQDKGDINGDSTIVFYDDRYLKGTEQGYYIEYYTLLDNGKIQFISVYSEDWDVFKNTTGSITWGALDSKDGIIS